MQVSTSSKQLIKKFFMCNLQYYFLSSIRLPVVDEIILRESLRRRPAGTLQPFLAHDSLLLLDSPSFHISFEPPFFSSSITLCYNELECGVAENLTVKLGGGCNLVNGYSS